MFTKVNSCANIGLNCELVEVETDESKNAQFAFLIVGLADAAVQEAKERVRFALRNSGLRGLRYKTVVNLAPADLHKEGPGFDLAIAVSILQTTEQLALVDLKNSLFVGELALNGETRHTSGILPIAIFAKEHGYKNLFIPEANAAEAALISDVNIYPVKNLFQLFSHLTNHDLIEPLKNTGAFAADLAPTFNVDMAHVHGQEQAKRALEIAAAGCHNVLMSGPPGSGKTLLARTIPSILPAMQEEEILEVTKIYSVAGLLPKEKPIITARPFRSPHHTSSGVALVGGGKMPKPGEISLAHRGILFLDEFPEFPRPVLENLRQPLEDGVISISRASGTLTFPARFTLIASQNPCPCGYFTDTEKRCTCTPMQILKYQKKVSGPIIDRIDLHIEVPRVNFEKLQGGASSEPSSVIRERIKRVHDIQKSRFQNSGIKYNAEMRPQDIKEYCQVDQTSLDLLRNAVSQMHLSARSYHRILKISRTIADLENCDNIQSRHIAEALQYRPKE